MADTTTKGFPYPEGPDPVDVAGDIQALAEAIDDMPGVQSYTGSEIAALAVGEKWAGRIVWNSTTGKLQVSNGSTFSDVDTSLALSSTTPAALGVAAVGNGTTAARDNHVHAMPSASDVGAIASALVNAKGDLVTATANDTPAILTAGSNGQMLMADSSATAGLRYVDPPTNRNLLINSAMQVSQRGTSVTSITSGGHFTADGWRLGCDNLGTWTQSVETDAPSGSGLVKSLKMLCTTADAAPAASDVLLLNQRLEGQNVQSIRKGTASAQQLSVSFWVKSNVTGTYIVEIFDNDNARNVSASYTVSASATWERKTITFPADATGVLDNDNGHSLRIVFWLAAGSNFTSGTLNTAWASASNANTAVGQTNLAAATNNYWQVTGVQLETGPVATPFEFEPYEATLRKCQRYYQKSYAPDVAPGDSTMNSAVAMFTQATNSFHYLPTVQFSTPMRANPTVTIYTNSNTTGKLRNVTDNTDVNAAVIAPGVLGFTPRVDNVSIAASKDLRANWVAEIEL